MARRDGGWQGEMAAGKERRRRARRDSSRQGEMVAGKERRWGVSRDSSGARRDGRGGARKCTPNQWGPGPEQIYSTAAGRTRSVIQVTWATPGRNSGELGQFLLHSPHSLLPRARPAPCPPFPTPFWRVPAPTTCPTPLHTLLWPVSCVLLGARVRGQLPVHP